MNKTLLIVAAPAVVAASLHVSTVTAELSLDTTPVTQETCLARFVRDGINTPVAHVLHTPKVSTKFYQGPTELSTKDWPLSLKKLLHTVNTAKLDTGSLVITDCLGNSTTSNVRERHYELDNIYRQHDETRGWLFRVEAVDHENKMLRLLKLELPPNREWQLNKSGDGIIAQETLFHPRNITRETVPASAENAIGWFNRVRVTEIKRLGQSLRVTQRVTTSDQFDELKTWTLD